MGTFQSVKDKWNRKILLEDAGLVISKRKGKYRVLMFSNEPLKNLLEGWID